MLTQEMLTLAKARAIQTHQCCEMDDFSREKSVMHILGALAASCVDGYRKGCEDCAKACDVRFAELIAQHEEERAEGTRDAANRCRALKGGE